MTLIIPMVVGYVFAVRWLVLKLETHRDKLLTNLPEWQRCTLLIIICMLPFVGQVLCYRLCGVYALVVLIPMIGVLSALVNAMIWETEVFVLMQMLIGFFAWLSSQISLILYRLNFDDPMSKAISELFLFIELTILVIATVILAIRKHQKA